MIVEDIQLTGKVNMFMPSLPLVITNKLNSQSLLRIKEMIDGSHDSGWLNESTRMAKSQITSDKDILIKECQQELTKAKNLLKEKFPSQYRKEFRKVIRKNPIKAFIGWLLK